MGKKYSCFVISPIGTPGSEINLKANNVYELLIIPVMSKCDVESLRGDENANSQHIGMDVIQCIRDADLCVVDISYPNCNVYYELGLADALEKPVILLKEERVDIASLPADVASRKYVPYNCSVEKIRDARPGLEAFVRNYLSEMNVKKKELHSKEDATISRMEELLDQMKSFPLEKEKKSILPNLPMDLRVRESFSHAERAYIWEKEQQLDSLIKDRHERNNDQLSQILQEIRSVMGDAVYLKEVEKYSDYSAYIWNIFLECAVQWLKVDMSYCVLDIIWLKKLIKNYNFTKLTENQYLQLAAICDRVLALSHRRYEQEVTDFFGNTLHFDEEIARYYAGLCAFNLYMKNHDRKYLEKTEEYWKEMEKCASRRDTPYEYEKKRAYECETKAILIKALWEIGHLYNAEKSINDVLRYFDNKSFDFVGKRTVIEDMYMISRDLELSVAEKAYKIMIYATSKENAEKMKAVADQKHVQKLEKKKREKALREQIISLLDKIFEILPVDPKVIDYYFQLFPAEREKEIISPKTLMISVDELRKMGSELWELKKQYQEGTKEIEFIDAVVNQMLKTINQLSEIDGTATKMITTKTQNTSE